MCALQAPEYDAKQPTAVWHKTSDVNHPVIVSVSESHIESLFCQTLEGTDGRVLKRSTKVCVIVGVRNNDVCYSLVVLSAYCVGPCRNDKVITL